MVWSQPKGTLHKWAPDHGHRGHQINLKPLWAFKEIWMNHHMPHWIGRKRRSSCHTTVSYYPHCCGSAPAGSWAPPSHLLILPRWDGGENQKGKTGRTHELRWRQFNRESKSCMHRQSKEFTHYFPSADRYSGSAVLAVSPQSVCTYSLLTAKAVWKMEKPWSLCKHCLATLVC